jgi:hypothetical protein
MRRRDELLRDAARAWRENRGSGGRKFGGEVATVLAERVRSISVSLSGVHMTIGNVGARVCGNGKERGAGVGEGEGGF